MPYTSEKPPLTDTANELRARIWGWGVDIEPEDRPSVPKERSTPPRPVPIGTSLSANRRSGHVSYVEHKFLTSLLGTSCPAKGLSRAMRKNHLSPLQRGPGIG